VRSARPSSVLDINVEAGLAGLLELVAFRFMKDAAHLVLSEHTIKAAIYKSPGHDPDEVLAAVIDNLACWTNALKSPAGAERISSMIDTRRAKMSATRVSDAASSIPSSLSS
jgi:hypothetical protein